MSSEDDNITKRRLKPNQIKMGTQLPRNMRELCFEFKGLMSTRVIAEFYMEQAGREYILAVRFNTKGVTRDALKANTLKVARLTARHIHD